MAVPFLRTMVGISFLLGTLALTWYASMMYRTMRCGIHHHNKQQHGQQQQQQDMPPQPLWDASTKAVYGLGTSWWILTCLLVYLVPLVMKRGNKQRNASAATTAVTTTTHQNHHKSSDRSRRLIFWFLVVAPSLWVFLYGTSVGWVGARARIKGEPAEGDDGDSNSDTNGESTTTAMEWLEILVLASALPSGTAGMMSMGIYVFGTVAKHSPLWSAYVVLPGSNNGNASNNASSNNGHANLMKDALRLHQWAGYVTFAWFVLHTILYCFIYGVAGVMQHFAEASEHINDINNATATSTATADAMIANATNITTEDDVSPSTTLIFFASMWKALVPPQECRPILDWWGSSDDSANNTTGSNSLANHTKHGRRQLYRVLFEEEPPPPVSGQEEALYSSSSTNSTMNSTAYPPREEELHSVDNSTNTVSATNASVIANTGGSSKFSKGMGFGKAHGKGHGNQTNSTNQEQQQQQEDKGRQCYGYYRNFNGFIAILSILVLVLTSLTFVRRKNYRFFYISHIVTAIIFLVTMILHMKRIIVYLMPSLVLYFATTIPSWIESLAGAIFDGGVNLQDCTVLRAKNSQYDNDNIDDGVAEIAFWVETDAGEAKEVVAENKISHRPKSVRICVPSISLIWYPFTVIEPCEASNGTTNAKSNLVKYKVLFGTVGYFTKSFWKRLYELEQIERGDEREDDEEGLTERDDFFDDEDIPGGNGGSIEKQQKHFSMRQNRHKHPQNRPPLILVDGFYSGAADWIENARQHDFVLIAAGGTGVTPFLTFVPKLLRLLREGGENCAPAVSFLWCCRDEALIEHVVTTYLLPLFQTGLEQDETRQTNSTTGNAQLRLMIYNTSRDCSDSNFFELESKQKLSGKSTIPSRGVPMKPSRLQHHPYSSRTRVVAGILAFLSIALAGVGIHLWADKIVHANRHMFSVRLYGLLTIVAWTIVVGILTEATWRFWSGWGLRHIRKGYSIANKNDHESSLSQNSNSHAQVSNGDDETIETTENAVLEKTNSHRTPTLLEPGRIYSEKSSESQTNLDAILELSISNGRPILNYETEYDGEDDDNERGDCALSPSEATLKDMVEAEQPGVFYCGPQSLMEAIKSRVDTGRDSRRRLGGGASVATDCVYYEESFEM